MKTNQNKLVKQSVVGRVHHPTMGTTYRWMMDKQEFFFILAVLIYFLK